MSDETISSRHCAYCSNAWMGGGMTKTDVGWFCPICVGKIDEFRADLVQAIDATERFALNLIDAEETKLLDQLQASGMNLRTVIGGFIDMNNLNAEWIKYLKEIAEGLADDQD